MDKLLKGKVDAYLTAWKTNPDRKPLIIKGARWLEIHALWNGLPNVVKYMNVK